MPDFDTLAQRYIDIWNDTNPATRRSAIEQLWAPDAEYIDPMAQAQGHDAIDAIDAIDATIAAGQAQFPGLVFRLAGPVDAHHQQARFQWELGASAEGEAPVAVADDHGRLRTVLDFLDRVPAA